MRHTALTAVALLGGVALLASPLTAQTPVPKELDVHLDDIKDIQWRAGSSSSGETAFSFENKMCNISRGPISDPPVASDQVAIDWYRSKDENHPFLSFLFAAEFATGTAGSTRFQQISDRSWMKHFFSATTTQCLNQPPRYLPGSSALFGRYCSDIYDFGHNGDRNHLAPADENSFDPWKGIWTFAGSWFDSGGTGNGTGPHAPPSPGTNAFIGRVRVKNASLNSALNLYFQAFLILSEEQNTGLTEMAADKLNNIGSRRWEASEGPPGVWTPSVPGYTGNPFVQGSILKQWNGATVTDNESTAAADEGVYYVAVRWTGPVDGLYTYEYAIQNRDKKAGACKVQIDWCADAKLYGTPQTFDIDSDSSNNWTACFPASSEYIQFQKQSAGPTNPILWNTIRNLSFVSDAIPVLGDIRIYPEGGGSPITIQTMVPHRIYNTNMGGGCGVPAIRVYSEDTATIGGSVKIWSINHYLANGLCVVRFQLGATLLKDEQYGCIMWLDQTLLYFNVLVDVNNHRAFYVAEIPDDPALEGASFYAQTAEGVAGGGGWDNTINFGNGLDIRIVGDDPIDCRACNN